MLKQTEDDDLKWMDEKQREVNFQDFEEHNPHEEEFKVTMAQNMFAMDDEPEREKKVVKKKKKKRGLPFRKVSDDEPTATLGQSGAVSSAFNPYEIEDTNEMFNMDSIMEINPKK